jgi:hypothetical protein
VPYVPVIRRAETVFIPDGLATRSTPIGTDARARLRLRVAYGCLLPAEHSQRSKSSSRMGLHA